MDSTSIGGSSDSAPDYESYTNITTEIPIHPEETTTTANNSKNINYTSSSYRTVASGIVEDISGRKKSSKKRVSIEVVDSNGRAHVEPSEMTFSLDTSNRSASGGETSSSPPPPPSRKHKMMKKFHHASMIFGGVSGSGSGSGGGGGRSAQQGGGSSNRKSRFSFSSSSTSSSITKNKTVKNSNITTTTTSDEGGDDNNSKQTTTGPSILSSSLSNRKTTVFKNSTADLLKNSEDVRRNMGFVMEESERDDDDDDDDTQTKATNNNLRGFEAIDLLDANNPPKFHLGDPINDSSTRMGKFRNTIGAIINNSWIRNLSTFLIIVNAIILGALTFLYDNPSATEVLETTDIVLLILFTIEVVMQLMYLGPIEFCKNQWLLFDGFIIGLSWIFLDSPLSIFRSFRIFRLFALVSRSKSLKRLFKAVGRTMPKMGTIAIALLLFFYVFCVMYTSLYHSLWDEGYLDEDYFGRLDYTFLTLFQMMTLDSWTYVVRQVMEKHPFCWIGFMVWVVITAFFILNLVVAVICDSLIELHNTADKSQQENKQIEQLEQQQKLMAAQKQEMEEKSRLAMSLQREMLANQVAIGTTLVDIMKHLREHHNNNNNNPYHSATTASRTAVSPSPSMPSAAGFGSCDMDFGSDGETVEFEDVEMPPDVRRDLVSTSSLPPRSVVNVKNRTSLPREKKNGLVDVDERSMDLEDLFSLDDYNGDLTGSSGTGTSKMSVQQMLEVSKSEFSNWSSNLSSTDLTTPKISSSSSPNGSYSSPIWTCSRDHTPSSNSMKGNRPHFERNMSILSEDDEEGYSSPSMRVEDDHGQLGLSYSPPSSPNNISKKKNEVAITPPKSSSVRQSTGINKCTAHSEAATPVVSNSKSARLHSATKLPPPPLPLTLPPPPPPPPDYSSEVHFARKLTERNDDDDRVPQRTIDYESNDNGGASLQNGDINDNQSSPQNGIRNDNESSQQDDIVDDLPMDNQTSSTPNIQAKPPLLRNYQCHHQLHELHSNPRHQLIVKKPNRPTKASASSG